jgi:hypothetical protein
MDDFTAVDSPRPTRPGAAGNNAYAGGDGALNVLLTGKRMQITADFDRACLARLREVLERYEVVLVLMDRGN